jgi:hypothetical protein
MVGLHNRSRLFSLRQRVNLCIRLMLTTVDRQIVWWHLRVSVRLVINRHAVEEQCLLTSTPGEGGCHFTSGYGSFCFRLYLAMRLSSWAVRALAKTRISDCVGNQSPVVEFVNTWPVCRWCHCVLELCGQLHAPADWLRRKEPMAVLDDVI